MLSYMRKNAGSWVIRLLLFGIAVVFAFWGIGSYTTQNANTVLTVDQVKVPYTEYRDIYNTLVDSYRAVTDRLDPKAIEALDLKGQAINALTQRYLLLEGARRLSVTVSPSEVAAEVTRTPAFSEGGIFSEARYNAYLDASRMTRDAFEKSVERDLALRKVSSLISLTAVVTPQEVDEDLALLTRRIAVKLLELSPNDFVRQVPPMTDEEVGAYLQENIELFRVPEKFTEEVVIIDPSKMRDQVEVSDQDVEDRYEEHLDRYTVPAAYRLRHVLFAFPADAQAPTIARVRERAEGVVARIRKGDLSLEKAVTQFSDDKSTSAKGGDLGFVEEADLETALLVKARELKEGEVSDPVPTSRGFEVIAVIAHREARPIPLDQVRSAVADSLRRERAFEKAYDAADALLEEVEGGSTTLSRAASARGLDVLTTPAYSRKSRLPEIDFPKQVLAAAFDTEEGEVGDIYENSGKLYLFQTVKRTESYLPSLDEVKAEASAGLLVQRATQKAYEWGVDAARQINEGGLTLEAVARKIGRPVTEPPPFTITDESLPGIEKAKDLVSEAFSLSKPGQAAVSKGLQSHHIVVLSRVLPVQTEELQAQRKLVEETVLRQKQQNQVLTYVENLRAQMADKIKVNESLL